MKKPWPNIEGWKDEATPVSDRRGDNGRRQINGSAGAPSFAFDVRLRDGASGRGSARSKRPCGRRLEREDHESQDLRRDHSRSSARQAICIRKTGNERWPGGVGRRNTGG